MELPVTIRLPVLWDGEFKKTEWGFVNFLIGPNGTGKTLFALELKRNLEQHGLQPRYLNAERLAGLERQNYGQFGSSNLQQGFEIRQYETYKTHGREYGLSGDAFILLNEKMDLRSRVEATLSQLFDRELSLSTETGSLQPKLRKSKGEAYDLKQHECHGLKELISILTFLYDDGNNCLIIDEPELHLHPQFQNFLLQHIRQLAGDPRTDPTKKCFFLITHSPFLVDIRTVDDLSHCVIFHPGQAPTFIDSLDGDDLFKIKRLLPRLNTHHKQFFFSSAPIFVEGYTDQQLFSLIQEKQGRLIGAVGSCLIDVTGKDEMALFFRLCDRLSINGRYITDLDTLFSGSLRQKVAQDARSKQYIKSHGLGVDCMAVIGQIESPLTECIAALEVTDTGAGEVVAQLRDAVRLATSAESDESKLAAKKRYILMVAILHSFEDIANAIPQKREVLELVKGKASQIIEAFRQAQVFLLTRGELENYLPSLEGNPFYINGRMKSDAFDRERTHLLDSEYSATDLRLRYRGLVDIMDAAILSPSVSVEQQLIRHIADWAHKVQSAYRRGAPRTADELLIEPNVEWKVYSRLFELVSFVPEGGSFTCTIKLNASVDSSSRTLAFTGEDVPSKLVLPKSV